MHIAVIGYGSVGTALGHRLLGLGHDVVYGAREPDGEAVSEFRESVGNSVRIVPIPEAIEGASVVVLAVPHAAALNLLSGQELGDRVIIDCTNPIGSELRLEVPPGNSGAQALAAAAQGGRFVKAFNIYGHENFLDPDFPNAAQLRPAMFLAGDDGAGKLVVSQLSNELGFEPIDIGPLAAAIHLEHLAMIWIRLARLQNQGPDFVWARLTR